LEKSQFASVLELFDKLRDRAKSVGVQKLLDVDFFTVKFEKST
jgi:hypothetical protein